MGADGVGAGVADGITTEVLKWPRRECQGKVAPGRMLGDPSTPKQEEERRKDGRK